MDDKEARRLLKRAIISARRAGYREHAEDLGQTVILNYLLGHGKHQTVGQATQDAIRALLGDTRGVAAKRRFTSRLEPLKASKDVPDNGVTPEEYTIRRDAISQAVERLTAEQLCLAALYFIQGFKQNELAAMLKVSEPAMSFRVATVNRKLREVS